VNTPRTKPPVRYQPSADDLLPPGIYTSGIHDAEIAADVCRIITEWPHIEEHFIPLFAQLTGITDINSARIVFRTVISQDARLKIMKAMLEKAPHHADKTIKFDELIAEFKSLNGARNEYAHAIWWTEDQGKVYLSSDLDTYFGYGTPRLVPRNETTNILSRTKKLLHDLLENRKAWGLALALMQYKEQP
jgi:hypothetical protein